MFNCPKLSNHLYKFKKKIADTDDTYTMEALC